VRAIQASPLPAGRRPRSPPSQNALPCSQGRSQAENRQSPKSLPLSETPQAMPGLIPKGVDIDPFHGGKTACPGRRGAQRDAPWIPGVSGKRRNAPGGPFCPTEGRPQRPSRCPLWIHRAVRLWRPTPRRETAPGETAFEGGEMGQYPRPLVLGTKPVDLEIRTPHFSQCSIATACF
jgi:hypothetical protein